MPRGESKPITTMKAVTIVANTGRRMKTTNAFMGAAAPGPERATDGPAECGA